MLWRRWGTRISWITQRASRIGSTQDCQPRLFIPIQQNETLPAHRTEFRLDEHEIESQPGNAFFVNHASVLLIGRRFEKCADGGLLAKRLTQNLRQRHLLRQVEPLNPNLNSFLSNSQIQRAVEDVPEGQPT